MIFFHRILRTAITSPIYLIKKLFPPKGITVLLYHKINDEEKPNTLVTPTKVFAQQMAFLKERGFKTLSINEFMDELKNPSPDQQRAAKQVLITFDDGWKDNFTNAFPLLKQNNQKCTIFVTTGKINNSDDFLMSNQIQEMSKYGIDFGGHTVSHPHLTILDPKNANVEIVESKKFLENLLKMKIISFCYPYGKYNKSVIENAIDSGFECAFTVKPGKNTSTTNLFELRRTELNGIDTLNDFKKKMAGAFDLLHKIIQSKFFS